MASDLCFCPNRDCDVQLVYISKENSGEAKR